MSVHQLREIFYDTIETFKEGRYSTAPCEHPIDLHHRLVGIC